LLIDADAPAIVGAPAVIGIPNELAPLLQRVAVLRSEPTGPFLFSRARAGARDFSIVACGMGKVNAAMATQALIKRLRPSAILCCGSAGGLCADMQTGDLVIGSQALQHDAGVYLGGRFVHVGVSVEDAGHHKTRRIFHAEARLVEMACMTANYAPGARPTHVGLIASGDQVIFSREKRAWLRDACGALAVDMESAAVAQVAQAYGVPWLIIRGVSDAAGEDDGFDVSRLVEYVDEAPAATLARRAAYLATHPAVAAQLSRLRAGVQLAAERAAELVIAALERL